MAEILDVYWGDPINFTPVKRTNMLLAVDKKDAFLIKASGHNFTLSDPICSEAAQKFMEMVRRRWEKQDRTDSFQLKLLDDSCQVLWVSNFIHETEIVNADFGDFLASKL